jgi:hypothetical protein
MYSRSHEELIKAAIRHYFRKYSLKLISMYIEAKLRCMNVKFSRTCENVKGDEEIYSNDYSLQSCIICDRIVTDIGIKATATQTSGTTGQIASGGLK